MRQLRRHRAWAGLLGLLALTLAACGGGGGDDGVATLGGASSDRSGDQSDDEADLEPEEAAQKFAECMREHGIDMPDPEIGEDGGFSVTLPGPGAGAAPDPEKAGEAQEACQHYLDDAIPEGERPDPEDLARMREQALEMAQCMRDEGITNWPDPKFNDDGGISIAIGPDQGIDPSDPRVQEAMEHCQNEVGLPGPGEEGGPRKEGGPTTERGPGSDAETNAR